MGKYKATFNNNDFLNKENILLKTNNGKQIFERIFDNLGHELLIGRNIKNPFYKDKKPSLLISNINGNYFFNDFGDSDYRGDVFAFAGHYYNLIPKHQFHELLQTINDDLRLGLTGKASNQFKSDLIDFKYYNQNELAFWENYGITETILEKYNVKSVNWFSLKNNTKGVRNHNQLIFAYKVNFECFKIYQPENKKFKFSWIGNKPENYIFGFEQLDYSKETLIITAGEKDVLTFSSLGYNAVCFNSETEIPSSEIINKFKEDFQNVIICYDNDETGKKQSKILASKFGITSIDLSYLFKSNITGKDISDYVFQNKENKQLISKIHTLIEYTERVNQSRKFNLPIPIPIKVYDILPELLLNPIMKYESYAQQELILLSTITILSGLMPSYYVIYDKKRYEANLFLFVIGKAASGKGIMNDVRIIAELIQEHFLSNESTTKKLNEKQTIFIPADSSQSALITILNTNEERGLIFETEADVLNGTMKQDWGDYSTILRKAFQHEAVSIARKIDNELLELKNPKLTCLISGTVEQSKKFLNIENGLFSRFIVLYINNHSEWRDTFSEEDAVNHLEPIANWLLENYMDIKSQNIKFSFSKEQQDQFYNLMSEKFQLNQIFYDKLDLGSSIKRLGLILTRIAMILSLCEKQNLKSVTQIVCSNEIFEATMSLLDFFYSHLTNTYQLLTNFKIDDRTPQYQADSLYYGLPKYFTRQQAIEVGTKLGIQENYIDKLLGKNKMYIKKSRGNYEKI